MGIALTDAERFALLAKVKPALSAAEVEAWLQSRRVSPRPRVDHAATQQAWRQHSQSDPMTIPAWRPSVHNEVPIHWRWEPQVDVTSFTADDWRALAYQWHVTFPHITYGETHSPTFAGGQFALALGKYNRRSPDRLIVDYVWHDDGESLKRLAQQLYDPMRHQYFAVAFGVEPSPTIDFHPLFKLWEP